MMKLKSMMMFLFACAVLLLFPMMRVEAAETVLSEESVYMMPKRTYQLGVTVSDEATEEELEIVWMSSDESVASVDENGLVTSYEPGTAIITATVGEEVLSCEVRVEKTQGLVNVLKEFKGNLEKPAEGSITFDMPVKSGIILYMNASGEGHMTLEQNGQEVWKWDVESSGGEVYCWIPHVLEPGNYTIRVECINHLFYYEGYILYEPVEYHKAKAVKLNEKQKTVAIGKQFYLRGTVTPFYAMGTVKWSSSNKSVASVDEYGLVTAKKMGKAVITVSIDGKKAKCTVYVTKQTMQSWTGKTKDLSKSVKGVPGYKKGKWTSSKPNVVSVDSKGEITFRAQGKAKITLKAKGKKYVFTVYSYDKIKLKNAVIKKVEGHNKRPFSSVTIRKKKFDNKNFTYTVKYCRYDAFWGQIIYTAIGYYSDGKIKVVDNWNWI